MSEEYQVLLDGKSVPASAIDPARHRYLGMFRPAANPLIPSAPVYAVVCVCGRHLKFIEESRQHYRDGCCDVPQYATIAPLPQLNPNLDAVDLRTRKL